MAKYLIDSTDIEIEEVSGTQNLKFNFASGNSLETQLNNLSNYSTTETSIGKWTDNKTLYRRVLNVTSPSVLNTYISISDLSSVGIDTLIRLEGFLLASDGRNVSINNPEPSYTICTTFLSGNIEMKIESNLWESRPCIIIIEYTKN